MRGIVLLATAAIGAAFTSTSAMAADSSVCGPLPNAKWSWSVTEVTNVTGGGTTSTSDTSTEYSNGGRSGVVNGTETTTTTTTTAPTYSQIITTCTAMNPAGKVNADHSTTVAGEVTTLDPGGSTSSSTSTKICGQGKDPVTGAPLPACPAS